MANKELDSLRRARVARAAGRGRSVTKCSVSIGVAIMGAAVALLLDNLKREPVHKNVTGVVAVTARDRSFGLALPSLDAGSAFHAAQGVVAVQKPARRSHGSPHPQTNGLRHGEFGLRTRRLLESFGYFGPSDFIPSKHIGPGTGTVGACFVSAASKPQSRISSEGGTASYTQMRRLVRALSLPPGTSVRIEEYLNYFDYEYPEPLRDEHFGVVTEVAEAPWNRGHKAAHRAWSSRTNLRRRVSLSMALTELFWRPIAT